MQRIPHPHREGARPVARTRSRRTAATSMRSASSSTAATATPTGRSPTSTGSRCAASSARWSGAGSPSGRRRARSRRCGRSIAGCTCITTSTFRPFASARIAAAREAPAGLPAARADRPALRARRDARASRATSTPCATWRCWNSSTRRGCGSRSCGCSTCAQLDLVGDQVKVLGKGRKERIVPVGTRASLALRRYLLRARTAAADCQAPIATRCSSGGAASGSVR